MRYYADTTRRIGDNKNKDRRWYVGLFNIGAGCIQKTALNLLFVNLDVQRFPYTRSRTQPCFHVHHTHNNGTALNPGKAAKMVSPRCGTHKVLPEHLNCAP